MLALQSKSSGCNFLEVWHAVVAVSLIAAVVDAVVVEVNGGAVGDFWYR